MMRKAVLALVAAILLSLILVIIGRHERATWHAKENRGIARVRQAVGARLTKPDAFRASPTFTCLLYPRANHALALELCFAPTGAIVEAIERSPGLDPKIWTLRSEPSAATVRENPTLVAHILDRLGAQTGAAIQVGGLDLGPQAPTVPAHG